MRLVMVSSFNNISTLIITALKKQADFPASYRSYLRTFWQFVFAFSLILAAQPYSSAQGTPPLALPLATQNAENPHPSFVTLSLADNVSMDTEIIQWQDGSLSIPVKTFAALFGITIQQSEEDKRLFFVDPVSQKRIDIYWEPQRVSVDDQDLPLSKHPIIRSKNGLLIKDDIYLDQALFTALFQVNFVFDSDNTTLSLSGNRKLNLPQTDGLAENLGGTDLNVKLIRNPAINHSLIDKLYINHSSNYGYQIAQQPIATRNGYDSTYFTALIDTSTFGFSGSLLGLNYYVKPSIIRYNKKMNFQQIDWSIQHEGKKRVISLGSTDAGLSTLSSPTLNLWGIKLASRNAVTPMLMSQPSYEFLGKATNGNQITVQINNRTVQTVTAHENTYETEPVYLQPQAINEIQITEKDSQNQQHVLLNKTVAYFANMLPKGETAYSAFLGRTPLQFYPLIPDQKTPLLMPQSEKWLTGGRFFYGLTNRLTVGVSGTANRIFGTPKTYYTSLNPLSVDLTGFTSYQRDPSFFNGENVSLSLRYQLTDRWLLSTDMGLGHLRVKPGSLLSIPSSASGKAAQIHLERQGSLLSWYLDAFRYDPYYYTPTVSLYGSNLYDKQGIGGGVNGIFTKHLPINYSLNWNRYQTNLERLISGGVINANHWGGSVNSQLNSHNNLGLNVGIVHGSNRQREFVQRSFDLMWQTQSLPWRLQGEVRAGHYFTNTLFFPSRALGTDLLDAPYKNNSLETSVDIPLDKLRQNHIRMGNRLSTFVNYGYLQGFFQYRQLFCEPLVQISYADKPQTQDRLGIKLGYQFKSGAKFSVAYYKINSSFQSASGILARSNIKTDQFYFDFSDILGLMAHRLQSLGPNAAVTGTVTGTLFVDYNLDGKMDKSEPGVKRAKLMIDNDRVVVTDDKGRYSLSGLTGGYHSIEVIPDDLPVTLNAENPIYKVKVGEGKNHRLNISINPEGGGLSGQLVLSDVNGKAIVPKNMTLVLLTPQGTSVKYTAVDEQGRYKFSNIPSGRYQIDLESKIKASGRYKILNAPPLADLVIPKHYEETSEIKNLDFKILAL